MPFSIAKSRIVIVKPHRYVFQGTGEIECQSRITQGTITPFRGAEDETDSNRYGTIYFTQTFIGKNSNWLRKSLGTFVKVNSNTFWKKLVISTWCFGWLKCGWATKSWDCGGASANALVGSSPQSQAQLFSTPKLQKKVLLELGL